MTWAMNKTLVHKKRRQNESHDLYGLALEHMLVQFGEYVNKVDYNEWKNAVRFLK